MTHYTRADVAMADRHIAEGEQQIVQQEGIVTKLQMQGQSTTIAENLLAAMNTSMVLHRTHRTAIIEALEAVGL